MDTLFTMVKAYGVICIGVAFILTFIRLLQGPSLPDRVIALDLMTVIAIAFIGLYSIIIEEAVYLDAAIALALVSFLGTVAFARYIEHNALQRGAQDYMEVPKDAPEDIQENIHEDSDEDRRDSSTEEA